MKYKFELIVNISLIWLLSFTSMIVKAVERMDVMNHTFIEPVAPSSLLLYELLRHRIELSPKEKNRYERLVKGYIGERTFEKFYMKSN